MTYSQNAPFRAGVVGSYLRPAELKQARADFAAGKIDEAALKAVEDNAITELVAKQKAAGLHVITDGEFRRGWWHLDCMWGFAGVEKVSTDKGYFFHDEETRAESARLTSKIAFDPAHPFVEHFKFIKQFEDDTAIARQTIPAPAQLYAELFHPENIASVHEFYGDTQKDYDELADDNAKAFHGLIMALYEAGCRSLQLDDCTWGMLCDTERRKAIRRAHSTTHLLDAALKKVLGEHVHQAGSLVEPDRLRFDFTHFEAITPDQLHQVEELVNDAILEGYPVVTEVLPIEEAKKKGAVAMFGEKYGDTVRVVEMGDVSIEFCGGTHVDNTAKAGPFRVKSETSVASGVRRIEATCGKLSLQGMERSQGVLHKAAQFLKTAPAGLLERMEQQANEMKQLRQALDKLKAEASLGEAKQFLASAKTVKGLHVITTTRTGMDTAAMRTMGDFLRDKDPSVVAVIASINGEKVSFLAVCGKEAVARGIKAGDLVRAVSAVCGGKGGGKPDSAMGGGTELLKVDDALASVDDFVSEKLS